MQAAAGLNQEKLASAAVVACSLHNYNGNTLRDCYLNPHVMYPQQQRIQIIWLAGNPDDRESEHAQALRVLTRATATTFEIPDRI